MVETTFKGIVENDLLLLAEVLFICILHRWYLKEIKSFNMLFANCLLLAIY